MSISGMQFETLQSLHVAGLMHYALHLHTPLIAPALVYTHQFHPLVITTHRPHNTAHASRLHCNAGSDWLILLQILASVPLLGGAGIAGVGVGFRT
jgi:hypothetical protein